MQTDEIVKLTRKRITALCKSRQEAAAAKGEEEHVDGPEKRRHPRWPFHGAVEIWPDGGDGRQVTHGSCLNMSESGIGISCDEALSPNTIMEVAVHLPELTFCGRATVRYCAKVRRQFMVGLEFIF
jgi:hypothetical protein